jgi:hypothetical protein
MKTRSILRNPTGLRAFFPTVSRNVQEVQPVIKVAIATRDTSLDIDRPNLLSKRAARQARRNAH